MFRFIHAADPHLDSPLQGLELHEGAPVEVLRGATRKAFVNLVDLALAEKVDFLVIAGDLYDGDWKDYSTGLFFRAQIVRLKAAGIPVYLIAGNHDAASVISKRLNPPENLHVFSTRTAESVRVDGLPAVIHGRGFPHRAVPENLSLEYPAPSPGLFNLGLLHTSLTGRPGHDTYAPCSEQDLRAKGYHYWALGHIHQPEVIARDPWIVFAGNCQGRHVRETGPRGCFLVAVNDALEVESADWRPLDVVRWEQVAVDLTGVEEEAEALARVRKALEETLGNAEGRLVAARIVLGGACPLHGAFHRDTHRLRAEIQALAQDLGQQALWLEQAKIETAPVYDLAEMARRDDLTQIVLETLAQASLPPQESIPSLQSTEALAFSLPAEIAEMLEALPHEIRSEVEKDLEPSTRPALIEEIRAITLEALQTKGGIEA